MKPSPSIRVYASQSAEYQRAFQVFLKHTDQKAKTREWLSRLVQTLPSRELFVDAGAGNGKVTEWFISRFQQTIAIEPNPHLCEEIRGACPTAEVLPETILSARLGATASLVLCSHVLGYIDRAEWMPHLDRLASWLASDGVLVVALQNPRTDCMRMRQHFGGERFDLSELAGEFEARRGNRYTVAMETVPAQIVTADFDSSYLVAEFVLNPPPEPLPPARRALEDYLRTQCRDAAGGFRLSCDQDFLQIRLRG
jgi:hypothetical protein